MPRKVLGSARTKVEGSRFDGAPQIAVSSDMIKLLDEKRENKSFQSIKTVMTKIWDTHVPVNGVQIGKRVEDERASDSTASAMLAQSSAQLSH